MRKEVNMSDNLKFDQGKPKMNLLFEGMPDALLAVGEVLTFGATKYEEHSWKKVQDNESRYRAALIRHALSKGVDSESGLLHRAHEACNALFLLQLEIERLKDEN